jgi:hypothetical protein
LSYTDAVSILDQMVPAPWGLISRVVIAVATLHIAWNYRRFRQDTQEFAGVVSLVLAVTIIIIPSYALYNQVMLLPAVLTLLRDRQQIWRRNLLSRLLFSAVGILLCWPWAASTALAALSFILPSETVQRAWALPAWTVPQISVGVAALMLFHFHFHFRCYQSAFTAPPGPRTS